MNRLSVWARRRDRKGCTTGLRMEASGPAAMLVIVVVVLTAAIAILASLRDSEPVQRSMARRQLAQARLDVDLLEREPVCRRQQDLVPRIAAG